MKPALISRDAYDQATQAYENSKADYEANSALTDTQKQQLAYYQIRAPFSGVVGDIPVHLGDYVSSTTVLTTVDENVDLEAYIYIPTERAAQVRTGLPVEILDTDGNTLAKSTINFLSPQVDNGLQSILAKAPVPHGAKGCAMSSSSRRASLGTRTLRLSFRYLPSRALAARLSSLSLRKRMVAIRPSGSRHAWRDRRQYLSGTAGPQSRRQSHHLRSCSFCRKARPSSLWARTEV